MVLQYYSITVYLLFLLPVLCYSMFDLVKFCDFFFNSDNKRRSRKNPVPHAKWMATVYCTVLYCIYSVVSRLIRLDSTQNPPALERPTNHAKTNNLTHKKQNNMPKESNPKQIAIVLYCSTVGQVKWIGFFLIYPQKQNTNKTTATTLS